MPSASLVVSALVGAVLVTGAVFLRRLLSGHRALKSAWAARAAAGELTLIPVRQLELFENSATRKNGIMPLFAVDTDGIRFFLFGETYWPAATLAVIDIAKSFFGADIVIDTADRQRLRVSLRDEATARGLLAALPPGAPLTDRAIAMLARHRGDGHATPSQS